MSQEIIELCQSAAELNRSAKYRKGNIVHLPDAGRVVVAGDLHGNRRNFEKIVTFADLENNPDSFVVLQEILHGGPEDEFGGGLSFRLFFDVLRFQLRFPDQVYLILGNHDTAIITDSDILRTGKEMTQTMKAAMNRQFAADFEAVDSAMKQYLLSQPLAVKCEDRIWISHSIPADRYINDFDTAIFDRQLQPADMTRPGSAYLLTWGRRHTQQALAEFARLLDVNFFLLGHQSQDAGWASPAENLIILASDHSHGCVLELDLAKSYTLDELTKCIVPLASIA